MPRDPTTARLSTAEETARYVVAEAVWAPSVHNTQPWRFVAEGPQFSLYADAEVTGVAGLLTTAADRRLDWVNAGQALQRILLTASAFGAAVALHSQPAELPWLRDFIRTHLSDGAYPHLVLRIGLVTQAAASVRRDFDDVLLSPGGGRVSPAGR